MFFASSLFFAEVPYNVMANATNNSLRVTGSNYDTQSLILSMHIARI